MICVYCEFVVCSAIGLGLWKAQTHNRYEGGIAPVTAQCVTPLRIPNEGGKSFGSTVSEEYFKRLFQIEFLTSRSCCRYILAETTMTCCCGYVSLLGMRARMYQLLPPKVENTVTRI